MSITQAKRIITEKGFHMKLRRPGTFVALLLLLSAPVIEAQVRILPAKPVYDKLDSALSVVLEQTDAGIAQERAVDALRNQLVQQDQLPVSVRTIDPANVSAWISNAGGRVANTGVDVVEAYVTPSLLRGLNLMPEVLRVSQIVPSAPRLTSQGVAVHNASAWHAGGYTGAGVKVGVIDSFQGIAALIGTEIPNNIVARCYSEVGVFSGSLASCQSGSEHGTAVAESLVDVAPGISLYIANPISRMDFRNTIDWMTSQGVRVINYSNARWWDGPGDGTSPYSDSPLKAVDAAVANSAVFVTAAGNEGEATYLGAFNDQNGDNWAEFPAGVDDNAVFLSSGEQVTIQLRWQDSWTAAVRDLDLALYSSTYTLLASSSDPQDGFSGDAPFEVLTYTASVTGTYYIGVHRYSGTVPGWIQLQNATSQSLEFFTGGSIGNPAETANPGALAVGAAAWSTPTAIEWYSSQGPTPDGRAKPEIVGADLAATVTYGSSFPGTSQASSHVAGLAALALQAFPAFSPSQVTNYLKNAALPRGSTPNNTWGYGFAWLPSLVTIPSSPTGLAATPAGSSQVQLMWTAVGNATSYTVKRGTVSGGQAVLASGVIGTSYTDSTVTSSTQYFYVVSAVNSAGESANSSEVSVMVPNVPAGDFDGDGKSDVVVYRPATGTWYVLPSSPNTAAVSYQWGVSTDIPVPGDYDGDGKADIAIFRPSTGTWYVLPSAPNRPAVSYVWGVSTDVAIPNDYDGDGRTDVAVYRPSTGIWYVLFSSTNSTTAASYQWGVSTDIPVPGDYDGDGKADIAIYRPSTGTWYLLPSIPNRAASSVEWGVSTDLPVPTDYDGDGRTDIAIYRPSAGTWWIIRSATDATSSYQWGGAEDIPVFKRP